MSSNQKHIDPSVELTAFNCPHCGALAKQFWWAVLADNMKKDATPFLVKPDLSNVNFSALSGDDLEEMQATAKKMARAIPYLSKDDRGYTSQRIGNVHISSCYNCDEIALWTYDRMLWPVRGNAPEPNTDLPADIRADYEEAATIADLSPRGSAAMLRLALQKLCLHLGGSGKNINDDIALLVSNGLDKRVQQALDVVRVIGNNAVHPGQIDLKDDRATVGKLFALVNLITEIMISQPKHVDAMYDGLPASAKEAIKKRDKQ